MADQHLTMRFAPIIYIRSCSVVFMFYNFLKGLGFYALIPLKSGGKAIVVICNLIYILFQIRKSLPAARQEQGREEKNEGEEAHSQSHL